MYTVVGVAIPVPRHWFPATNRGQAVSRSVAHTTAFHFSAT